MHDLLTLGWNEHFQKEFEQYDKEKYQPARVVAEYKNYYRLASDTVDMLGELSGRMHYDAKSREDLPAVGDWVVINKVKDNGNALIRFILKRSSKFSRKMTGEESKEQIIAANVDIIFIVQGLDHDFNLRRIERALVMAFASGSRPVIILNKTDACPNVDEKVREVEAVAAGAPVHPICSLSKAGYENIISYPSTGQTIAFIGSSGVGKSTIINNLLGDNVQKVNEVREDDSKGRHTTTRREIFVLPSGGLLLDTPGMRELQLWETDEGVKDTFNDIEEIALKCRFSNCRHQNEPHCAVREAAETGTLDPKRLESFHKLSKEREYLESKENVALRLKRKEKEKQLGREQRKFAPSKGDRTL